MKREVTSKGLSCFVLSIKTFQRLSKRFFVAKAGKKLFLAKAGKMQFCPTLDFIGVLRLSLTLSAPQSARHGGGRA